MRELGITGKIATITAGWQERESEDSELNEHLEGRTVNLRLYARAEEAWKQDPELRLAHRARQDRMRHKQDFYRIRLEHELEAAFVIQTRKAPPEILDEERDSSIHAIRDLDDAHLRDCVRERERFINGARALGLDDRIGSLEVGKLADIIAVDLSQPETQPLYNPLSQLIYACNGSQVTHSWIGGTQVMQQRELSHIDLSALGARTRQWRERIHNRPTND